MNSQAENQPKKASEILSSFDFFLTFLDIENIREIRRIASEENNDVANTLSAIAMTFILITNKKVIDWKIVKNNDVFVMPTPERNMNALENVMKRNISKENMEYVLFAKELILSAWEKNKDLIIVELER